MQCRQQCAKANACNRSREGYCLVKLVSCCGHACKADISMCTMQLLMLESLLGFHSL